MVESRWGRKLLSSGPRKTERKELDTREKKNFLRVVMSDPYCQSKHMWNPLSDILLHKSAGEYFLSERAEPSSESINIKSSKDKAGLLACPPLLLAAKCSVVAAAASTQNPVS